MRGTQTQYIRNFSTGENCCSFELHCDIFTANALRRALISDIPTIAPNTIVIRKNTSCQTDEYIAHRIGLIPFSQKSATTIGIAKLDVSDRAANTHDIVGNYSSVHNMVIMKLIEGQCLDVDINFDTKTGLTHSRYSSVAAAAYEKCGDVLKFKFEVINDLSCVEVLQKAMQSLMMRLDNAERQMMSM